MKILSNILFMKTLHCAVILLLFLSACSKDDQNNTTTEQLPQFKGIVVRDDIGNTLAFWGTDDGDWGQDYGWKSQEYDVLIYPDTIDLGGTYFKDTTGWEQGPGIHEQPVNRIFLYPNPANYMVSIGFHALGNVKFKMAIVDQAGNRLCTWCVKDSMAFTHIDLSDQAKFMPGNLYRFYYSMSAGDNMNYYKGHGDLLICHEPSIYDCEKYVP
jgi:hypothetical protein